MSAVAQLFYDTVRVLQEYRVPLRSHALHAYHSAFVTMPECSLLHALQQEDLPGSLPSMVSPRTLHWGSWNRVIDGHTSDVTCVAVSPDGQRIVSGSRDGTVRVWSIITLEELAKLTQGQYYVCTITFSPDGARFVTSSVAGLIHIWDSATLQQLVELELNRETFTYHMWLTHDSTSYCSMFSNDGTRIVAAAGGDVCVWSAMTFEELGKVKGHAPLALSPDDTRIVACRSSSTLTELVVYDATTLEALLNLETLTGGVRSIAFSPDNRQVVFGLTDNSLRVWKTLTWKEVAILRGQKLGAMTSVVFSSCGTRIVSASSDQIIRLWDAATYEELAKLKGHEESVYAVAFSPDGTKVVSGSQDKTVRIWSAVDVKGPLSLEGDRICRSTKRDISFLPCGERIVSHIRRQNEPVRILDAETFTELGAFQHVPRNGLPDVIVWSLDGSLITTRYDLHNSLRIWNTITLEAMAELSRGFDVDTCFVCAAFSPDNRRIMTGMRDGVVLVWNIENSEVLADFHELGGQIRCAAYSPTGSHIAAGSERTLRVWDAITYEELYVYHSSRSTTRLEFSCDGSRLLALFFSRKIQGSVSIVWSVDKLQVLAQFEYDFYRPPTFTADGGGIIFNNAEGKMSAWMPSQRGNSTYGIFV
jgi:WD40 repeat protein